jgi:hypothetical protein
MKVICKADPQFWNYKKAVKKVTKQFFGLFSKTTWENPKANGPSKDEICTVYETFTDDDGEKMYRILGYGSSGYSAKWFIPLEENKSEFKETTFEEIKKAAPCCDN